MRKFTYEKTNSGQRESNPLSILRKLARFRRKPAAISALTALSGNGCFARIAQNYAVRVSEFVRKRFSARMLQIESRYCGGDVCHESTERYDGFHAAIRLHCSSSDSSAGHH